jgi:hypothetical protein
MSTIIEHALQALASRTGGVGSSDQGQPLNQRVAGALGWLSGLARLDAPETHSRSGELNLARAYLGPQPAAVFAADGAGATQRLLSEAARFAYHVSAPWGVIADDSGAVIFNSHWIRNGDWFQLPKISWVEVDQKPDVLTAMTPAGVADGELERLARRISEPDRFLMPVDDALVARLDHWRLQALRYGHQAEHLDEDLHTLFAQLFVLRAVEDRKLAPGIPSLEGILSSNGRVDREALLTLFARARESIQSQLFIDDRLANFPDFVLAGIIHDLYYAPELPAGSRYDFAWIDADVLGRAYEKYLANIFQPTPPPPQLQLFDQPVREVQPVSVKKAGGIFYTPDYLVGTLTDQAIEKVLAAHDDPEFIPRVGDFACGSGSFLVRAVSALLRHLRARAPGRNWGRVLIEEKYIVGIDIDPRAVTLTRMNLWTRFTGEPDALPLPSFEDVVVEGDSLGTDVWMTLPNAYDVVLGNPPFIAIGRQPGREDLARRFQTAQGRFDYSHLFVELAVDRLSPQGALGMVVPNRMFRNRDAGTLRQLLTSRTDMLAVVDFGANEVFKKEIRAYIGAIIAQKHERGAEYGSRKARAVLVSHVTDHRFLGGIIVDALRATGDIDRNGVTAFEVTLPPGPEAWLLISPSTRRARLQLEQDSPTLGEVAGVYQGIRTGANDLFIMRVESSDGTLARVVNGLGDSAVIELALLHPVVFGSDIQRYDLLRPTQRLLYPYRAGVAISEAELAQAYPAAYAYLNTHRDLLASRSSIAQGGLSWYELVRRRDETWLTSPKLLTRDLATRTSFALDPDGDIFLVGGTAVVPGDPELLRSLLAYLNSSLASEYLAELTPGFRGAFQKFEPQHLNRLPVPAALLEPNGVTARLDSLAAEVLQARLAGDEDRARRAEDLIDGLVADVGLGQFD